GARTPVLRPYRDHALLPAGRNFGTGASPRPALRLVASTGFPLRSSRCAQRAAGRNLRAEGARDGPPAAVADGEDGDPGQALRGPWRDTGQRRGAASAGRNGRLSP